jgi:2-keto-4-pentenoate hydratase/2-oxohepta-3-ene-1,7-dioic acid hydratase in catechol pathway
MKLVSFTGGFGRVEGDQVVPMGGDLITYLETGASQDGPALALADVELLAPVPRPGKIFCIGLNYSDHAAEGNVTVPDEIPLFSKYWNSVIGPGAEILVPTLTEKPDFEAELGVIIGREAKSVSVDDALDYVAGYTCMNDVSARDLQQSNAQWMRGKAIDTFLPMGPYLVTSDEVPDPQQLAIGSKLNGTQMQNANTNTMVWSVAEIISFISETITLSPGDAIATGTPAGVGSMHKPPVWLQEGDVITIEVEGLGSLSNPIRRPAARGAS